MFWLENVVLIKENKILFESLFKIKIFNCFKKVLLLKKWYGIYKKIIFKIKINKFDYSIFLCLW